MERWLSVLAKAVLWAVAALLSLLVLAVALVLLLVGWLWALCRGRRLGVPWSVTQVRRWHERQVWRSDGQTGTTTVAEEVVDVEVREVQTPVPRLPAPPQDVSRRGP